MAEADWKSFTARTAHNEVNRNLSNRNKRIETSLDETEALDAEDREFLGEALNRHWAETDSVVARAILDDHDAHLAHFRKVMPVDYRRVLIATEKALAAGVDVNEAIMEAARG